MVLRGRWLDHDGRDLMNGVSYKRNLRERIAAAAAFVCVCVWPEGSLLSPTPTRPRIASSTSKNITREGAVCKEWTHTQSGTFDFPAPRTVRNKYLFF